MNIYVEDNVFIADILIVDDKLENIRFLSDFLSKQNYQVRKAINGQAALRAVKTLPPDLILLDINMPGMGGYEVCEYLKKDPNSSSIPIIFLSAGSEVTDKLRAFEVGGSDYITKPFQLEEVLVRVQTQLTVQHLQKQLKSRNEQLQNTLLELQKTQSELILKEKLVNAGRITAGISHEINNPLSFILGNLKPVSEYSQKLISLIQLYQVAFPDATPEISNFIEEMELDFLVPDFIRIIHSIRTGAERIRSVVLALHIFSRLDESGIKPINVHENIESVLMLLHHQLVLKAGSLNISIFKEYEDMPIFMGHGNLLNQGLLNILQNAIDALNLKLNSVIDGSFKPTIWISIHTRVKNTISISIKDNGIGISQENQAHLFEPFFTTKIVGQGVGLGLFTSHQIITEFHKGTLVYHACPEGGSEFIMEIPKNRVAH
ncbi:hybrid sensor histidine kinase/response regulator [Cylindrospermum sp. FACHB-282]|uniref:hybrid sensor histidine kinase/response regulator n=1 Tax=Cylindrospermum sp. FACHB-282 TaxID=2692794 RepID=UPI00168442EE|nr:response regulator [Cylindrospermum sp. FACHB-282]MBD2388374.1 response regulator [Cylindrospermum sp. FACHB-282]